MQSEAPNLAGQRVQPVQVHLSVWTGETHCPTHWFMRSLHFFLTRIWPVHARRSAEMIS